MTTMTTTSDYEQRLAALGINRGQLATGFEGSEMITPVSAREKHTGPLRQKTGRPPGRRKLTLAPPLPDLTHLQAGSPQHEKLRKAWLKKKATGEKLQVTS